MIFNEFFKICIQILRLDKNFFKENKNFGEASIYFAVVVILLGSIISIIPNSSFLIYMSNQFTLGTIEGPSLKGVIFTGIFMWIIKTTYLFFIGVILLPSKKTKCDFRKIFILVAFCKVPLLLNILIVNPLLLFLSMITFIWYNVSLIIGLKIILNYENYFKPTLILLTPYIIAFLYILSIYQKFFGTIT